MRFSTAHTSGLITKPKLKLLVGFRLSLPVTCVSLNSRSCGSIWLHDETVHMVNVRLAEVIDSKPQTTQLIFQLFKATFEIFKQLMYFDIQFSQPSNIITNCDTQMYYYFGKYVTHWWTGGTLEKRKMLPIKRLSVKQDNIGQRLGNGAKHQLDRERNGETIFHSL